MQVRPPSDVTRRLARWYRAHKRNLPWRRTRDPYAIWLSEVMLQQTTVEVVTTRWERFLRRFPTLEALARAPERAVLAEWSGLGYYARARNLHCAARRIVAAGAFPKTLEGLRGLPGVGAYTAAAVGSISFGLAEPVVDGNVVRVLCRLHALRLDPRAPATLARVRALARPLVPPRNPGEHNQAVMEFGALVCTPRAPRCGACPLRPPGPEPRRTISPRDSSEEAGRSFWLKTRRSFRATSSSRCSRCPTGSGLQSFLEGGGSGSRAGGSERSRRWRGSATRFWSGAIACPSSPSKKICLHRLSRAAASPQRSGPSRKSLFSLFPKFPATRTAASC